MKYQLESMEVSMVSVSRRGGAAARGAGDEPVADAVGDGALAPAFGLDIIGDGVLALLVGEVVELCGVHHDAGVQVGLLEGLRVPVWRGDDHADGDGEALGELEVALVVGGDAHDGAGGVPEEGVVGDPDGDVLAGEEVPAEGAGEDAGLC